MSLIAIIYAAFISLGLPDGILGAAWPQMAADMQTSLAGAGVLSLMTSAGTIVASFSSGWLLKRVSTVSVCISSVALTVFGLVGFALAPHFAMLMLCCIPLGLGAGAIDAALNAYVSLHFSAMHMNFLHACWGVGAMTGPLIAGFFLNFTGQWRLTYCTIAAAQAGLMLLLIFTRRAWPHHSATLSTPPESAAASLTDAHTSPVVDAYPTHDAVTNSLAPESIEMHRATAESEPPHHSARSGAHPWYQLPLIWPTLIGFLCYCSAEGTIGLWASTFLVRYHHLTPALAAAAGSAFYIGITAGRFLAGFASLRLTNTHLLRIGSSVLIAGMLIALLAPLPLLSVAGFALAGLGCAPIYPAIMKETGRRLGAANVTRVTGVQMGFAYIGFLLAPPLTGLALTHVSPLALPLAALALALGMVACHEYIERRLATPQR
ncbi:MAG: MFS transporter [Actinomycetaceae bacterium]|nr:MFS transporter [Arcanobacterium sp.]MDD7687050.1 MFS transporter [Actinomycetaceae bacterium]MDY5273293.1 MFS transporter [Arcanobacterium sp.]